MHAHHADDPAGGRIQRRSRHRRLGEFARVDLEALVLLGLQQPDQTGRLHHLDGVVGESADLFGFGGLFAHLVGHVHHSVEYTFAHDVVLRCLGLVMVYRSAGLSAADPDERAENLLRSTAVSNDRETAVAAAPPSLQWVLVTR